MIRVAGHLRLGAIGLVVLAWAAAMSRAQPPPATAITTQPDLGPDTVVLQELVKLYEPVPFDHRGHAEMAEMWRGCETCHHRHPMPTTRASTQPVVLHNGATHPAQADADKIPACKSCHEVSDADQGDIRMPNLKGAYHRQCLNCHREWMAGSACVICHKPIDPAEIARAATRQSPSPDDIVGRMHPPIPEPVTKTYRARFTPADGGNVLFRHEEHVKNYGLTCVNCHFEDSCAGCHAEDAKSASHEKPVKPARSWRMSHEPCVICHEMDRCRHCHYADDQPPPAVFAHASTGQVLDDDHKALTCGKCHVRLKSKTVMTCGGQECHSPGQAIAFPARRPGPVVTTQPATRPAVAEATAAAEPTTRPVIRRVR